MPGAFYGFDHADIRVASLAAVEPFYDARPYNAVDYHEPRRLGEPGRFVGFIEDPAMLPTATRLAFRVAAVADVVRWRARLAELGALRIEVGADFAEYPAVFFSDPAGTLLEICARNAPPQTQA